MLHTRSRLAHAALAGVAALVLAAMPAAGHAQTYPTRTVRLVVPFPPGGSNDIVGRLVGSGLGERLGRQIVVDNRPGGNSIIGTEIVARSPPDGYNLIMVSTSFTTNPIIHKLPYNPRSDFEWVAMLGFGPNVMAVHPNLPAKSIKELIALARARPNELIYASTGVGSNAHFGTELFKHMTGTRMLHVPFKGGGPAMIGLISGEAQLCLSSLIQAIPHIRSGKMRALATSAEKRSVTLPDVPTIGESGVPGYATANWWGIAAPRGTPAAVVKRLNDEIRVVLETPEIAKRMIHEGAEPATSTPEGLGKHILSEMDKWAQVAKIAGIRGE
jgi:tripartite-type tricarboxylate transporter receptor subunit TctC